MTKRDDVVNQVPTEGDATVSADAYSGSGQTGASGRQRGGMREGDAGSTPHGAQDQSTPDGAPRSEGDVAPSARSGVFAAGATEWAALADPGASAPGGPYSTGVSGYGADIGVLGTDNGTGTGVGVLGTVTNPENSQPAVYGFTQGSGPGVQGESDGPGPGVLGTDNGTGTGHAVFGELTNPSNTKAAVYGTSAGSGAAVEGDSNGAGPGVFGFSEGTGPGVRGASVGSNPGVEGQSSGTGPGVLALNDGSGSALEVQGPATFSRSGLATIAAKKTSVKVSFPGVTATSMVLATLQTVAKGVAVAAAVPDADSFTLKLTKKPKTDVVVAWFVMGS
ncbi:MAG TPA: hypothetical protein VN796_05225 [Acidimicrobiales bacterium]|nr:hypothetical protein [Acidimicrobiales bacterium]